MLRKPVIKKVKTTIIDDKKYIEVGSLIKYFKEEKKHYAEKKKKEIRQYNEVLINKFMKLLPKTVSQ